MKKLVRDNIPEIASNSGTKYLFVKAKSEEEYKKFLNEKLQEEVSEYLASKELEELVDIATVLNYLVEGREREFQELYEDKLMTKGGFDERYILYEPEKDE